MAKIAVECEFCEGSGECPTCCQTCPDCQGSGEVEEEE